MFLQRGLVEVVFQNLQRLRPRNNTCVLHALTACFPYGCREVAPLGPNSDDLCFSSAALWRSFFKICNDSALEIIPACFMLSLPVFRTDAGRWQLRQPASASRGGSPTQ